MNDNYAVHLNDPHEMQTFDGEANVQADNTFLKTAPQPFYKKIPFMARVAAASAVAIALVAVIVIAVAVSLGGKSSSDDSNDVVPDRPPSPKPTDWNPDDHDNSGGDNGGQDSNGGGDTPDTSAVPYLLSLMRPSYASSSRETSTPDLAFDADPSTRWESVWQKDPQWIYCDLGAVANITNITLVWEGAFSTSFVVEVSDDEAQWVPIFDTVNGVGGTTQLNGLNATGRFVRMFSRLRAAVNYGISLYAFDIYGTGGANKRPKPAAANLAAGRSVTVSSLEVNDPSRPQEDRDKMLPKNYAAEGATDGDPTTRWSSIATHDEWIYIDLGAITEIGAVVLQWEASFGRVYDILVANSTVASSGTQSDPSDDAAGWALLYRTMNGAGGTETIPLYAKARFVQMKGHARGTDYGYSLWEFKVLAYVSGDPKPTYSIPQIRPATPIKVGNGSYEMNDITMNSPKSPKFRTNDIKTPIQSNDWWQSILVSNLGDGNALVTLPLKNSYTRRGLTVLNPGQGFATADGGSINADGAPDFYLTASALSPATIQTKVSNYTDFSATVIMNDGSAASASMKTTFVKGSPFIYNTFLRPDTVIVNGADIVRLFDKDNNTIDLDGAVSPYVCDYIGVEIANVDKAPTPNHFVRPYGFFFAANTTVVKLGNTLKITLPGTRGGGYLSIATLPKASDLAFFYERAYAFVVGTRADYAFDEKTSIIKSIFSLTTVVMRVGFSDKSVMALLPHQWKIATSPLTDKSYPSIRGLLKLSDGNVFTTADRFLGLLPQFAEPTNSQYSRVRILAFLDNLDADVSGNLLIADPYWQGKKLHPLGVGILIADQIGDTKRRDSYLSKLRTILVDWYTFSPELGEWHTFYFHYSAEWGTLIPFNSGFGVNTGITDHHFTYGYYLFGSAILAMFDQSFLDNYGPMADMLARDYANPDRNDPLFPWFRSFDPYEGHSWAGGYADNLSGNNQEAAGESLFSWVGEYVWGVVSGNKAYRDAAIWGFMTELKAAEQYWFNFDGDNWAPGFDHASTGMVFGSAYLFGTYFSGEPEEIYGIHWLPTAEWMSYYGKYPAKAAGLYKGMIHDLEKQNKGSLERTWQHIIWPLESLSDTASVLAKWNPAVMQQNEVFNAYWFIHNIISLGQRSLTMWADDPAASIYEKEVGGVGPNGEAKKTFTAQIWNPSNSQKTYRFYNEKGLTGTATVYAKGTVSVDAMANTVVERPKGGDGIQYIDRSAWTVTASASSEGPAEQPAKMIDAIFRRGGPHRRHSPPAIG